MNFIVWFVNVFCTNMLHSLYIQWSRSSTLIVNEKQLITLTQVRICTLFGFLYFKPLFTWAIKSKQYDIVMLSMPILLVMILTMCGIQF